ncbi:MAG: SAV_915 family protein [Dermatophilaceae bacterium]
MSSSVAASAAPDPGQFGHSFASPHDGESFDEFQARYRASIPPVLYVPLVAPAADGAAVQVEMRTTADQRVALLVYTALDRLMHCCGPHQPFAVLPTTSLDTVRASSPFDVVYVDLVIPEELRRTADGAPPAPDSATGGGSAGPEGMS